MTPKASIIIPCYNIALHISKCIESLLVQTYQDFELLLINDGSTDNTLNVIEAFAEKDNRIKVFSHDNKGVSYTRNRGIEVAKGEMILFIDGDDYVKPDYVEQLVRHYKDGVWPICGMINVKKGVAIENENYEKLISNTNHKLNKEDAIILLKYSALGTPCARVYSTKIINENKLLFDVDISYQEDLLFDLKYIKFIKEIKVINYFGYYYIEHAVSSTGRYHQNFNQIEPIFEKLKKYVNTHEDKMVLQEFILYSCLKEISNILHINSKTMEKQKIHSINLLFKSTYFKYANEFINKLKINLLLKILLKIKSAKSIYYYFKLLY